MPPLPPTYLAVMPSFSQPGTAGLTVHLWPWLICENHSLHNYCFFLGGEQKLVRENGTMGKGEGKSKSIITKNGKGLGWTSMPLH